VAAPVASQSAFIAAETNLKINLEPIDIGWAGFPTLQPGISAWNLWGFSPEGLFGRRFHRFRLINPLGRKLTG
jgi:hypothetical protein